MRLFKLIYLGPNPTSIIAVQTHMGFDIQNPSWPHRGEYLRLDKHPNVMALPPMNTHACNFFCFFVFVIHMHATYLVY